MIQKLRKNRKGFTLIELIVVIAILGILAAILIPQFSGFQVKATSSQIMVNAKQVATAADSLFVEKNAVPTQAEIVKVAGPDILAAEITAIDATPVNGHVGFTYAKTLSVGGKSYDFTAIRTDTTGKIVVDWVETAAP